MLEIFTCWVFEILAENMFSKTAAIDGRKQKNLHFLYLLSKSHVSNIYQFTIVTNLRRLASVADVAANHKSKRCVVASFYQTFEPIWWKIMILNVSTLSSA